MSNDTVPQPPQLEQEGKPAGRPAFTRELALALVLVLALGFVVWGVAGWSPELAKIVAGIGMAGLAVLFLVEVS
jgi:hypothetical protein